MFAPPCGRLPHDPVRVAALPSLEGHPFAAAPPPAKVDRRGVPLEPETLFNDIYPDCTCAALINAARGVAKLNDYDLAVQEDLVPAFYASVVGCEPTAMAIAATNGAYAADVLAAQVSRGFDIGPQALSGLYGRLLLTRPMLANSINRLGHVYAGITLYERDMEMNPVWNVQPGRSDGQPYSGHMVNLWDYQGLGDNDFVRIGTWGAWQTATWAWVEARVDEAYALFWRQLAGASGVDMGVDADTLAAEHAALVNP